ncbi:MAG: hypothetical protein LBQ66_05140 [Planctomycetaceae bacterium]|nr:hypothetical protein [Planctomycetaceae bacterium]
MGNRPPGGYVASESLSLADNGSGKRIGSPIRPPSADRQTIAAKRRTYVV